MYWIEWFVYMLSFALFENEYVILSTVFLLPTTSLVFSTLWKNLLMQRRWMRLEKLPKVFLFLRLILESFGSEQKEKRTRLNSDLGKSNLNFCERNIFFQISKIDSGQFLLQNERTCEWFDYYCYSLLVFSMGKWF